MGIFSKIKRGYRKPMLFGAFAGLLLGSLVFFFANRAQGVSFPGIKQDCDNNAVIYCGALNATDVTNSAYGYNHKSSVRDIYEYFGISATDVKSLGSVAVAGKVTKSGDVLIGNTVVATGATTAGRQYIAGSSKAITYKTATFYKRAPSVSFASSSLDAYVVMSNGKFDYAIIAACGNPVVATPKLPNDTITKEVQVKGTSTWGKSVTVQPGTHVNYRITVASTGQIPINNVMVSDKLPTHITYVAGTLARDGKKVADSTYFANGLSIGTLNNGTKTVLTYEAVVGQNDTVDNCVAAVLTNTANVVAVGLPAKQDTANVSEQCQPKKPSITVAKEVQVKGGSSWSKSVDVKPGATVTYRITYTNTGNVSINNATISDKLPTHATFVPGTMTFAGEKKTDSDAASFFGGGIVVASMGPGVSATVIYDATIGKDDTLLSCTNEILNNTASITSTAGNKQDTASVNKQCQPKPKYTCNGLTAANSGDRTSFVFAVQATLENVTLKSVNYTVKDKSGKVISTIPATSLNPVNYTQNQEGDYSVNAVVTVNVDGNDVVAPGNCAATFTVTPPPVVPAFKCEKLIGNAVVGKKNTAQFVLTYLATGGAKLTNVSMNWGDSTSDNNVDLTNLNGIVHVYGQPGTYNVAATLSFVINGDTANVKTDSCATSVTVTQPMCTVPGKENLPADSSQCFTPCPTNPSVPASDTAHCTTPTPPTPPTTPPTKLINTGPGSVVGMFAATTIGGMIAYRLVWLRRFNG